MFKALAIISVLIGIIFMLPDMLYYFECGFNPFRKEPLTWIGIGFLMLAFAFGCFELARH